MDKQIAQTIIDQIKYFDATAMMCWGVHNLRLLPEMKIGDDYMLGGLQFHVQDYLHKGIVRVWLCANDTYTVQIGYTDRKADNNMRVKETMADVYCDMLAAAIEGNVETKNEWTRAA